MLSLFFKKNFLSALLFFLAIVHTTTTFACDKGQRQIDGLCVALEKVIVIKPNDDLQAALEHAPDGSYFVITEGKYPVTESLTITDKKSLILIGEGKVSLVTESGWVTVLVIKTSENITVKGLHLTHAVERGYCYGAVMEVVDSKDVRIINNILDGSGTQAVVMRNSEKIMIIEGQAIHNTEGVFEIVNSKNIKIDKMKIEANDNSSYLKMGIIDATDSSTIFFTNNTVVDNQNAYFKSLNNSENVVIENNQFSGNTFNENLNFVKNEAEESEERVTHPIDHWTEACLEKNDSTLGMVECLGKTMDKWDVELNSVYKALMGILEVQEQETLKETQKAWIKYRDTEFKAIDALYSSLQGTMWGPVRMSAKSGLIKERTLILQTYLDALEENQEQGEVFWQGESGGFSINWSPEDLIITQLANDELSYSAREILEKEIKLPSHVKNNYEHRYSLKLLSVVGNMISVESKESYMEEEMPHPQVKTRYYAMRFAEVANKIALSEFFPSNDILQALLHNSLVQQALQEAKVAQPPTTLEVLQQVLSTNGFINVKECGYNLGDDFLNQFAFHHLDKGQVAIHLNLELFTISCQGKSAQLEFYLAVPPSLKQDLENAQSRETGFLMRDLTEIVGKELPSTEIAFTALSSAVSTTVDTSKAAEYLTQAKEKLQQAEAFETKVQTFDFIEESMNKVKEPAIKGELTVLYIEALQKVLAAVTTLEVKQQEKPPYNTWLQRQANKNVIFHDEIQGTYLISSTWLWEIHDGYYPLAVSEKLAWMAANNPLGGECEGDMECYLLSLEPTLFNYLLYHSQGKQAKEALTSIVEDYLPAFIKYSQETQWWADEFDTGTEVFLARLRAVVEKTNDSELKTKLLEQLATLNQLVPVEISRRVR